MNKYAGLLPLLLAPTPAFAAMDFVYTAEGAYTLSADAGGNATLPAYGVQVNKPANATVHKVFAITMSTPSGTPPSANALTFTNGLTAITPTLNEVRTSSSGSPMTARFDDVTAELETLLNGLPDGESTLTVTENALPGDLDGSALLVIWNDPSASNTLVSIRLGAERTDQVITHTVTTNPIAVHPGLDVQLGAGVSFSTGVSGQQSNLAFNGTQLTTILGGNDDGAPANGALITLGGLGDTLLRTDNDELFGVTDLVTNGDTALTTTVTSSSTNDYLYALYFVAKGMNGVVISTPADGAQTNADPVYTGFAVPNATVEVTITDANNAVVFTTTVTADASGQWTVPAQNLPDGTYTITATANNLSDANVFTLDTVAPTITLDTPANDLLTNDNTVTFSGTTEANTDVTVTILDANNVVVATLTTTSDATGAWTVDSAALADSTYTASATATDEAGNTAPATTPVTFTIDTLAPAIALVTPANPTLTNDNTIDASGTAEPGATIEVTFIDDNNVALEAVITTADANGDWTATSTALNDGIYTVNATATDAAGNTDNVGPHLVIIDTVAPLLTLTAPAASASQNNSPDVTGTSDPGQTVTVTVVDANGAIVFTGDVLADGNGDWLLNTSTLADGTYTVTATTSDLAGNVSTSSVTFTVDTLAPDIDVTGPVDGSFISQTQPTLTGLTEPGTAVTVTVTDANGTVHTENVVADATTGIWTSAITTDLADGAYTVDVTATDEAGNVGTDSSTFTVDTTVLPLDIDEPVAGSVTSDTTPTFSGTTAPNEEVTLVITTMDGNEVVNTTVTADENGNWTFTPDTEFGEGSYDVTATVTTRADVTTTANTNVTVDTTGPTLVLDSPTSDGTLADTTPTVAGTTEPGSTVAIVVLDADGNEVTTADPMVNPDGTFTVDTTELPDGTYTVVVTATDEAGNQTALDPVTFTIDTTAPEVAITSPAGEVEAPVTAVSGTAEPGATVDVVISDADGNEVATGQATADASGNWTLPVDTELGAGEYTVSATATDDVGNTSDATESTFTIAEEEIVDPTDTDDFAVTGGCSTTDNSTGSTFFLALLGLLGLRRRRK